MLNPFKALMRIGEYKRYDMIFLNSVCGYDFIPLALLLRKVFGKKVMVVHHHFEFEGVTGLRRRCYKFFEDNFIRSSSAVVIPSPFVLDKCRAFYPGHDMSYWQIPFEGASSVENTQPEPGNLLYIGTVEYRKGLDRLIDAMSVLKKRGIGCRLTIVGKVKDEEYCRGLRRQIETDGLDVTFAGFVSAGEKARLLSRADVFTFPSRHEGYGMVICESLVEGLPVVCFDNSAMPYTVTDGVNGFLVPEGDTEAYADRIGKIITNRDLREKLSQGAVESAGKLMTPGRFAEKVKDDVRRRLELV